VRRAWIALAVLLAALLGFVAGFVVTLMIGISQAVEPECDGVCFSELPAIVVAAFAIGVGCGTVSAFVARRLIAMRFAKPS
jgi:hypothetical protein